MRFFGFIEKERMGLCGFNEKERMKRRLKRKMFFLYLNLCSWCFCSRYN